MNVNRWFSIVNKRKKRNWSKPSTILDPYLSPQFFLFICLFEFFFSLYTSVNLFVNRWHTIPREVCKTLTTCNQKKNKNKMTLFTKRMLRNEKLRLGTSCCRLSLGRMAVSLPLSSLPHFIFCFFECFVMIKYTVSSFHLTWKDKKKLAPSRRSP